jgi:hypothetical protein
MEVTTQKALKSKLGQQGINQKESDKRMKTEDMLHTVPRELIAE